MVALPQALQRGLERFAKKAWQPRALRIFRDETDLSATPGLWPTIQRALDESRFLVLLASPAAARSSWVQQEVSRWLATKGPETLLIVLVEGTLCWSDDRNAFDADGSSALVPALETAFTHEPMWVDLSWVGSDRRVGLDHAQFRTDVATLAAPIHGRSKRELEDVDVRENRRLRRFRAMAIGGLVALLVTSLVAAGAALVQRDQAKHQAAVAEARELAVRSLAARDPFAALALSIQAERRTTAPVPQTRDAFVRAVDRLDRLPVSPVGAAIKAHAGPAMAVAFSPDGSRVASGGDDGVVALWDAGTAAPVGQPMSGHEAPVWAVSFSPRDQRLASGDEAGSVRVWDLTQGSLAPSVLDVGTSAITTLAWSPDGARLAIGDANGDIYLAEITGGEPSPLQHLVHGFNVLALAWVGATGQLAFVNQELTAGRVDTATGAILVEFPIAHPDAHEGVVVNAAFAPGGGLVATVADDGRPQVWNTATGEAVGGALASSGGPMAWAPDRTSLVSAAFTQLVVHDLTTNRTIGSEGVPTHQGLLQAVAWSPKGDTIVTAGDDGSLRRWAVRPDQAPLVDEYVGSLRWSPDGERLTGMSDTSGFKSWVLDDGDSHSDVQVPMWSELSPDGRWAAASDSTDLWLYDVERRTEGAPVVAAPDGFIAEKRWSPDGTQLASLSAHDATQPPHGEGNQLTIWSVGDKGTLTEVTSLPAENRYRSPIAWAPDGKRIALADDGGLSVWTPGDPGSIRHVLDLEEEARSLVWSPSGTLLAATVGDGIQVWQTRDWKPISWGHLDGNVFAWSPDGSLLATASDVLTIWDVQNGTQLGPPIAIESGLVSELAWSPTGIHLAASGGPDPERLQILEAWTENDACSFLMKTFGAAWVAEAVEVQEGRSACDSAARSRPLPPLPVRLVSHAPPTG